MNLRIDPDRYKKKKYDIDLFNKNVAITGTIFYKNKRYTRNEMMSILKDLGASYDTNVTSITDYVIVGKDPGNRKMQVVRKYNIDTLSPHIIFNLKDQ